MATSRRGQKFGISVFHRVRGLLRSGAWSVEDKPIWFEVYRRFPPKPIQYDYKTTVPKILYPEDLLRKKFYSMYLHPDVADLTDVFNEKEKLITQQFIEKYFELQKAGIPPEELFEKALEFIQSQKIDKFGQSMLRHKDDIPKEKADQKKEKPLKVKKMLEEKSDEDSTWSKILGYVGTKDSEQELSTKNKVDSTSSLSSILKEKSKKENG